MKLYHFPASPNSRRVLATIYQLGLQVELETVDLARGEQLKRDYLRLNPNHMIPTLVDDDFVLWESTAIMQYLCSKRPNTLWPSEPRAQADVSRWLCWNLAHWNAACNIFIFERLSKKMRGLGEPDAMQIAKGEEQLRRFGNVLNRHLKQCNWVVDETLTLADFALASPLSLAEAAEMPVSDFKAILSWYIRIAGLPAWQQSDPARFESAGSTA